MQSPEAVAMVQTLSALTPDECQKQLAEYLVSKQGKPVHVEGLATGDAVAVFNPDDAWLILAFHAVYLLVPEFDEEEFSIILRRSWPASERHKFSPVYAANVLKVLCAMGLIRQIKARNSRSAAIYRIVERLRRPRQARS